MDLDKMLKLAGVEKLDEVFFFDAEKDQPRSPESAKDVAIVLASIVSKRIGLTPKNLHEEGMAEKARAEAKKLKIEINNEFEKLVKTQLK